MSVRSALAPDQTARLLDEAEDAFPGADFTASAEEWYQDKGFITEDQEDALRSIIRKSEERPGWMRDL
jgi:hypothetical protein